MKSLRFDDGKVTFNSLRGLFMEDFKEGSRRSIRALLEHIMEWQRDAYMDLELVDDYRNGYYTRDLRSGMGDIVGLRVPRTRSGGFYPTVLTKYERVQGVVDDGILEMYLRGVSTHNVGHVLKPLLGFEVSSGYVTKVNQKLDRIIGEYHRREIPDDIVYLFLDAIYIKERSLPGGRKKAVLVAYGIHKDGRREFIHFRIGKNESEREWAKFLNDLYRKGLKGDMLRLIITDGGGGLLAALDAVYPYVKHQRCWVHKMRNLSNKIRKADRQACCGDARHIYQADSRKRAIKAYTKWKKRWNPVYPDVVRWLEEDLESLLAFYECPRAHYKLIRTTNVIERGFGEVRRRTKVMGCLPNQNCINRIVYARIAMLNNKWSYATKYIKKMIKVEYKMAA